MAGDVALVAGVALAIFLAGALFMLLAVVAAGVRHEDRATMSRMDRQLRLRRPAPSYLTASVRRIAGVGQRLPHAGSDWHGSDR
jgi:hypothetical protein